MIEWNDVQLVLALLRGKTMSAAARSLGVEQTTVARRLASLEERLGTTLFLRTSGGLIPTAFGADFSDVAAKVEDAVLNLERRLHGSDRDMTGIVRLATTEALAVRCVRYALTELRERHPSLTVEIITGNRVADLSLTEADVSLRLVRPHGPDLVARKAGAIAFAAYASSDYVARRGRPRSGDDLTSHDVVHFSGELSSAPENVWFSTRPHRAVALRANGISTVLSAVACGYGVGLLPHGVAEDEHGLVHVFDVKHGAPRTLWLVTHRDTRRAARVRLLAEHLVRVMPRVLGDRG